MENTTNTAQPETTLASSTTQTTQPAVFDIKQVIENKPQEQSTVQKIAAQEEQLLSSVDIEKIKDPFAKKVVQDLYKHLQSGFGKKFQEVAEERKRVEEEKAKLQQQAIQSTAWTQERLRQELQKPDFVQAAQQLQATAAPQGFNGSPDEWSSLSPQEKQALQQAQFEAQTANQRVQQMLMAQEDIKIKERFPDYNAKEVDTFLQDAYAGRINDTTLRELVWKAKNLERYVEQAVEFGRKQASQLNQERLQGTTQIGLATQQQTPEQMQKNERPRDFFKRLAMLNASRQK